MRVVFHRVAHDIGHLVESPIIQLTHGMEDTTLHRLQSVFDGGHGTFQDDVGGIVQKPVLEHAFQRHDVILFLLCVVNLWF